MTNTRFTQPTRCKCTARGKYPSYYRHVLREIGGINLIRWSIMPCRNDDSSPVVVVTAVCAITLDGRWPVANLLTRRCVYYYKILEGRRSDDQDTNGRKKNCLKYLTENAALNRFSSRVVCVWKQQPPKEITIKTKKTLLVSWWNGISRNFFSGQCDGIKGGSIYWKKTTRKPRPLLVLRNILKDKEEYVHMRTEGHNDNSFGFLD